MVEACAHHILRLLQLGGYEARIGQLMRGDGGMGAVAPSQRLLPHQHAHLVAVVEEALALLVVAAAEEVAAEGFQVLDVDDHQRFGRGRAEGRVRLVAVRALQVEGLAVQPQTAIARLDGTDAEAG